MHTQTEMKLVSVPVKLPKYQLEAIEELKKFRYSRSLIDTFSHTTLSETSVKEILEIARQHMVLTNDAAEDL